MAFGKKNREQHGHRMALYLQFFCSFYQTRFCLSADQLCRHGCTLPGIASIVGHVRW